MNKTYTWKLLVNGELASTFEFTGTLKSVKHLRREQGQNFATLGTGNLNPCEVAVSEVIKQQVPAVAPPYDFVSNLIAFESGELDEEATELFFDHLVETGIWRSLQGSYGRALRAAGKI